MTGRPAGCGVGLRREHFGDFLAGEPEAAWLELITENFMVPGGRPRQLLDHVKDRYPLALHGVSLSIGSAEPVDRAYLSGLKALADWSQAAIVSDHLCWGSLGGHNSHDLLPLPFTAEALKLTAAKVREVQDVLGRRLLLENVSSYVEYRVSEFSEWQFLAAVAEEADCGILLDVNNVYVNARNHGFDPVTYIESLPVGRVQQFHVAGHEDHGDVVVDTHDAPVRAEVWALYARAVARFGSQPTLLERDGDVPPLDALLAEARDAELIASETEATLAV
jgi:uncharacterized protein (UPF0276 family)